MKTFKCVCGKEFKSKQALSGHKGVCKLYLGDEKYNNQINNIRKYTNNIKLQNSKNKWQELQQWISEKHKCEKCGKVMTEYYGSGRFCCKECARGSSNYKGIYDAKKLEYSEKCSYCDDKLKNKLALTMHIKRKHAKNYNDWKDKQLDEYVVSSNGDILDITKRQLIKYKEKQLTCEICGKHINEIKNNNTHINNLQADHNHKTKKFRGLLCLKCNMRLGDYELYKEVFEKYLKSKENWTMNI